MALLALDLGTKTGYAYGEPGAVTSGTADFKERFGGKGRRFLLFRRWLDWMGQQFDITEVVYEDVRAHMGVFAAHAYGGYLGALSAWAEGLGIPYSGVPVATIKKYATGNGHAAKTEADRIKKGKQGLSVEEAVKGWGYNPHSSDESDAIALFHYWLSREPSPAAPAERVPVMREAA